MLSTFKSFLHFHRKTLSLHKLWEKIDWEDINECRWGTLWITMRFSFTMEKNKQTKNQDEPEINEKWLRDLILHSAIASPHLTPFIDAVNPAAFRVQTKHRFPLHWLCACQSLTASWGAIHGWVTCLLPHPLLFSAAVQSALTTPGQVAGLHYSTVRRHRLKIYSCQGVNH